MQRAHRQANLSPTAKIAIGVGVLFIGLPILATTVIAIAGAKAIGDVANRPVPYPTPYPTPTPYAVRMAPMRRGRAPL